MRWRSWLVLTFGFGALLALIALLGLGAMRRAWTIHQELAAAHDAYVQTESLARDIPADLYLSGLLVRDYLLDLSHITAPLYREQLREVRSSLEERLKALAERKGAESATIQQLQAEVHSYLDSLEPVFTWTPQQKSVLGYVFLRQRVLRHRDAVVALAREITKLNAANLHRDQERLRESQRVLQSYLGRMLAFTLALGLLVAIASTGRVSILEGRAERQRRELERAEGELRRLSRNLVQAQEEERKSLSRELHDAVGQMLTATGMELANIESLRTSSPEECHAHLEEAKRLNVETLRSVRDLAMGLRPSMLDDLGLGPALEWQGREFSRRSGVPVSVQIDGVLHDLPETHRTSIYRVVQEALTNCGRHAQAKNIRVSVHGAPDRVSLTIQDDGVGFDPEAYPRKGLGLLGIQERVRELEGTLTVISQPHKGTMLKVEIPLPSKVTA